jgi:hypothetical protein
MRDRVIRLEEKVESQGERLKAMEAKFLAVVGALAAYVGSQLLGLLGGGAP